LMCDLQKKVEFFIDRPLWDAADLQCHPLRNTATLVIPHAGLETFLKATDHTAAVIDVPYTD